MEPNESQNLENASSHKAENSSSFCTKAIVVTTLLTSLSAGAYDFFTANHKPNFGINKNSTTNNQNSTNSQNQTPPKSQPKKSNRQKR